MNDSNRKREPRPLSRGEHGERSLCSFSLRYPHPGRKTFFRQNGLTELER